MKTSLRKKLLRTSLISKRRKLSLPEKTALDHAVAKQLFETEVYQNADVILLYAAMPMEVDTADILEHALISGKTVAFPRCDKRTHTMQFCVVKSAEALTFGAYGILEPDVYCPVHVPKEGDLCLVPGLGFDKQGNRIGFGGGYYDRFLSQSPVCRVGLCYDAFLLSEIPTEAFDCTMDCIVSQSGVLTI